ncbi:MAG TPA: hypothetical protein VNR64_21010, partial [Vicinamibacterales bacterium]|nr:hypothetical protein [Vicinamibacterales bacterium]
AIVLPLIGAATLWLVAPSWPRARLVVLAAGTLALLAVYFVLRDHAGSMTPLTAPTYYRFTFSAADLARNAIEYTDRGATYAAAAALIAFAVLWPARVHANRRLLLLSAIWFAVAYLPTIAIPSRSSLYACFPSIAAALACGHFVERFWETSTAPRRRAALAATAVIPLVCMPAYLARNHRWTDLAIFSTRVLDDLAARARRWPAGAALVLVDDRTERVNLNSAFGGLIGDAVALRTGRAMNVTIETPPPNADAARATSACDGCPVIQLALQSGRIVSGDSRGRR